MAHKYVLDTHALVWYLESNTRLSSNARIILDDRGNQFVLPLIALAEAILLIEKGRTRITAVSYLVAAVQSDPRIDLYPITWDVLQQMLSTTSIPEMHDRLIVATALHLQNQGHTVSLVTRDEVITRSGLVPVIW